MTIQEAISAIETSEDGIYRKGWTNKLAFVTVEKSNLGIPEIVLNWYYNSIVGDEHLIKHQNYPLSVEDILAEDWEVKE